MKKLLSILLAVVLAACSLSLAAAEPNADLPTKETWGDDLSGMKTTDIDGNEVTGEIFSHADVTLVNLWSAMCGPCVGEMPDFQEMHEKYSATAAEDVQIIGVPCTGMGATIAQDLALLKQMNYTYLNIYLDKVLTSTFAGNVFPETLVVDRNGIVRDDWIGSFTSAKQLESFIETWREIVNHEDTMCKITYVNGATGETITTREARYGYPVLDWDSVEAPETEGHLFKLWEVTGGDYLESGGYTDEAIIPMGDITVTATYTVQRYKVKFYDNFNTEAAPKLLNIQQVEYGKGATAPQPPEYEGYYFAGWDKDFSKVTGDLNVYTIYVLNGEEPPVTEPPATEEPVPPTEEPVTEPPVTEEPVPPTDEPVTEPPVTDEPGIGAPGSGDMDGDGETSVSDAVNIARLAMQIGASSDEIMAVADVNQDGKVDMTDALAVVRDAMGLLD